MLENIDNSVNRVVVLKNFFVLWYVIHLIFKLSTGLCLYRKILSNESGPYSGRYDKIKPY